MSVGLGLDCGGSATRWFVIDAAGRNLAEGAGPAISGLLYTPAQHQKFLTAIAALCAEIAKFGLAIDAAAAGVTGLSDDTPEAEAFVEALSAGLGIPRQHAAAFDDARIGYLASFEPGEGILVYSGTGSFAYHLDDRSNVFRAGGYGAVIDDGGSGYWIGREALLWLVRRSEGVPPLAPATLADHLRKHIGGDDWPTVRRFAYSDTRNNVASLSRPVSAAASAGDPTAITILNCAAAELARLVKSLVAHVGPKPVALTGGGASSHPLIRRAFAKEIARIIEDPPPVGGEREPPARAAAKLALFRLAE